MGEVRGLANVRIFDPGSGVDLAGGVSIEGGRITAIGRAPADAIDGRGLLLCPGLIDLRAFVPEPGQAKRETLESAARAAAKGGFTTVVTMPATEPALDRVEIVEAVLTRAKAGRIRIWPAGALTLDRQGARLSPMALLLDAGCALFTDADRTVADSQLLRYALETAADLGAVVMTHAEDPYLSLGAVMHEGEISARLGLRGAPFAAETVGVARDLAVSALTGARLHLAHLSTAAAVQLLREAKARGQRVTADVSPFHLCLTDRELLGYQTAAKLHPPLRGEADLAALTRALGDGTIDAVASDHLPQAEIDKKVELDRAAPGAISLETTLAVVLGLVEAKKLTLERAISVLTRGPAEVLGRPPPGVPAPGIGRIVVGGPADLVLIDPRERWHWTAVESESRSKNTPLAGRPLVGRAVLTIAAGEVAWAEPARFPELARRVP